MLWKVSFAASTRVLCSLNGEGILLQSESSCLEKGMWDITCKNKIVLTLWITAAECIGHQGIWLDCIPAMFCRSLAHWLNSNSANIRTNIVFGWECRTEWIRLCISNHKLMRNWEWASECYILPSERQSWMKGNSWSLDKVIFSAILLWELSFWMEMQHSALFSY